MAIKFSIPNIPSFTSETPNTKPILFVPDVQFLTRFVSGNLGIANKITQKFTQNALAQIQDPKVLREFSKVSGANLGPNPSQFFNNGKLTPPTQINIDKLPNNLGGLEALEKALIQSIFETQKPYVEIVKLVIENFVDIEDIIAHVLCVAGRSKKPSGNPKALGYQGTQDGGGVSAGLNTLSKLSNKKSINSSLDALTVDSINAAAIKVPSTTSLNYTAITQSIIYSTGQFFENVDYTYIYRDILEEPFEITPGTVSTTIEDEDDSGKDENIVVAVYDNQWNELSREQIGQKLPWLLRSGKYRGLFSQIKPGESFDFVYTARVGFEERTNVGGPGSPSDAEWKIKKYEQSGPSITVEGQQKFIKEGQAVVAYNSNRTTALFQFYKNYYEEYTDKELEKRFGTQSSLVDDGNGNKIPLKQFCKNQVIPVLQDFTETGSIPTQIEGLVSNNFLFLSKNNTDNLPNTNEFSKIAYPFKPKKIDNNWIDVETDYDMKIIKCDSTLDITFLETVGTPEKQARILRFVERSSEVQFGENQSLSFLINGIYTDGNVPSFNNQLAYFSNQNIISFDYFQDRARYVEQEIDLRPQQTTITSFNETIPEDLYNSIWKYSSDVRFRFVKTDSDEYKLVKEEFKVPVGSSPGTVAKWIIFKNFFLTTTPLLGTVFVNGPWKQGEQMFTITWKDSRKIIVNRDGMFRGILYDLNLFSFQPQTVNTIRRITYDITTNTITSDLNEQLPNLIRILDNTTGTAKQRIISRVNITNDQLSGPSLFSNQPYGTPLVGQDARRQTIDQIFRYQTNVDDVETFFILEGVLKSKNKNRLKSPSEQQEQPQGSSGGGAGYYNFPDLFAVIKKFIRLVIKLATKLFPAILQLLELIKNPAKFITDIIFAKLGDDFGTQEPKFGFFSKDFFTELSQLKSYLEKIQSAQSFPERLVEEKNKLEEFLNTSLLKNYVYVSNKGLPRFVLDGSSTIKLFGDAPMLQKLPSIRFGMETNLTSLATPDPKSPVKLIFEFNGLNVNSLKSLTQFLGLTNEQINQQIKTSPLYNTNFDPKLEIKNELRSQAGGISTIEEVSIQYSTGKFVEGVDYTYLYVTEEVKGLISKASQLEANGDKPSLNQALELLEQAQAQDPNNSFIKAKIDALKKLGQFLSSQPLLDFMLNLVTLPIKVVFGIITYIINFFKSLTNPFELPTKIIEFVSHKWLLDFFSPISKNSMFAMAGILFDIQTFFTVWLPSLKLGTKNTFDLNDIIKLPWTTWPTYTLEEFRQIAKVPLPILILNSILCLIEAIINSFIDFIWSLLGLLDPQTGRWIVVKPPYLKICKDTNRNLSAKDIVDLLNGNFKYQGPTNGESNEQGQIGEEVTYNFIYNIRTSDGRNIQDLNKEELDNWILENQGIEFTFDF